MNPINGISSLTPQTSMPSVAQPVSEPQGGKSSFGDLFKTYMEKVDGQQQASNNAIGDLLTGRTQDVLPVVSAVAESDMSFKLLLGVRNKVVEAYKQTMNMQI